MQSGGYTREIATFSLICQRRLTAVCAMLLWALAMPFIIILFAPYTLLKQQSLQSFLRRVPTNWRPCVFPFVFVLSIPVSYLILAMSIPFAVSHGG